jgi:hypothetical protein
VDSWAFGLVSRIWSELFLKTRESYTRHVKFNVRERFEGVSGNTFELVTGWGECCDCSMDFKEGQEYFVVAIQSKDGTWSTSICTGTRLAEYAIDEIEARRAKNDGKEVSRRVFGYLYDATTNDFKPVARASIVLRLGNEERRTKNFDGRYGPLPICGLELQGLQS